MKERGASPHGEKQTGAGVLVGDGEEPHAEDRKVIHHKQHPRR